MAIASAMTLKTPAVVTGASALSYGGVRSDVRYRLVAGVDVKSHLTAVAIALIATTASANPVPRAADESWVAQSDRVTQSVLEAQAKFEPEKASRWGMSEYDGKVLDLAPRLERRRAYAMEKLLSGLRKRLGTETDVHLRQDLTILIGSIEHDSENARLERRYFAAWVDVPNVIFTGVGGLLDDQVAPIRRGKARELLRRYVGDWPGTTPLIEQAKARFIETQAAGVLGPDRVALNKAIVSAGTYGKGIRDLFVKYKIGGAEAALNALDAQLADYTAWERAMVLPIARSDFRLPPAIYAMRLKERGIDIDPQTLIRQAQLEFAETRAAMVALAPRVAHEKGWTVSDYRAVIRRLKQSPVANDQLEASYAAVIRANEAVIRGEHIVDLPDRPMRMKVATAAESAANPAPHMEPPPMIGNTGEHGVFVLPIGVSSDDPAAVYDDFNFPAAQWSVAAHEGRPGHELQFSAMVERGVSHARAIYAFNSVNVEGWALYAEAEALPYHPLDGQLMALQARLLRAARAMLDPMLNLGAISIDDARHVLLDDVCLSPAMTRQELERYTSRAPGQAGSYFYGYERLLQLRMETELALGARFDRLAFNNFVIGQGLLSPDALAVSVRQDFIPAQRLRAAR